MAVSGRCLLSHWLNRRSANLGACTHPCRFDYLPRALRVEERTRPGDDTWEVLEHHGWSEVLAAEDLCLVKYLPWFRAQGMAAVKIEGRTKSAGHLAQVVDVYATALRELEQGVFRPGLYLDELRNAATRTLGSGFFLPGGRRLTWQPQPEARRRHLLAMVQEQCADDAWRVAVRAPWNPSLPMAVLRPGLERPVVVPADYGLEDADGNTLSQAHPGTHAVLRCGHRALAPGLFLRAEQ
jgi:putative protease